MDRGGQTLAKPTMHEKNASNFFTENCSFKCFNNDKVWKSVELLLRQIMLFALC